MLPHHQVEHKLVKLTAKKKKKKNGFLTF